MAPLYPNDLIMDAKGNLYDGDFQSCSITWAVLEVSHYFGGEAAGSRTAKIRTRVWELRGQGHDADCFAEVCS
jgi:hypothetical protein